MIRMVSASSSTALSAQLGPDDSAYADAEWTRSGLDGPLSALVVSDTADPDQIAAGALAGVAREACAAVGKSPPHSVAVTGRGLVATFVRTLLGERLLEGQVADTLPRSIIETTGDPSVIADSTRRVASLGLVVLAGEAAGRPIELDLYPDVHVRGLQLIGVGRAGAGDAAAPPVAPPAPMEALPGGALPAGAAWFRLATDRHATRAGHD